MPYGVGGAAAEGLRSGLEMGLSVQDREERRREFDVEQARRATSEERLRQQEQDRYGRGMDATRVASVETQIKNLQGLLDKQVAAGAHVTADSPIAHQLVQLQMQHEDMLNAISQSPTGRLPDAASPFHDGAAPQGSGMGRPNVASADPSGMGAPTPAPPAVTTPQATATNPAQKQAADLGQQAQDTASRLQTGQTDLKNVPDGDFALMMTAATGRHPSEIGQVHQHVMNWEAGMQSGNNGLMMQGLNGVFGPQIQAGVGGPSPYGGTITDKKIIGLDPALSADGNIHTDKVIPRLRVTTDLKGADGTPLYYDAPMTQNRSISPNDPVTAVSVQGAADRIGQLGTALTVLDHPDAQDKLQRGASDPRVQAYLDAVIAGSHPVDAKEQILQRYLHDHPGSTEDQAIAHLQRLGTFPRETHESGALNDVDAAERLVKSGTARNMSQAMDMIQRMTHPLPKAGAASTGAGGPAMLPVTNSGDGAPMTPDAFLKKLSPEDRQTVLTAAHNPLTLANVSLTKNRREHMQNLVQQYLDLQKSAGSEAAGDVSLTKGTLAGITPDGKPVGGITPSTLRFWTLRSIGGDDSWMQYLGRSATGAELIRAVKENIPKTAGELGLEPGDVGSAKAQNKALTATLQDRTKYSAAVDQLSTTMVKQGQLVKDLLAKGGATEGGPFFNKPYNAVRLALGSVDGQALDAALKGLGREHQRVLVSPLSNAQLAVQAQATGDKIMSLELTPKTIINTIDNVMMKEVANGREAARGEMTDIQQRIKALTPTMAAKRGSGMGASAPTDAASFATPAEAQAAADAGTLKSGTKITVGGVSGTWH